jgi:Domain of unknown function (DUF1906)
MSGGSSRAAVGRLGRLGAAIMMAAASGWPSGAPAAARHVAATHRASALTQVTYRGYRFEVPRSWPVIRVKRRWKACVRFDLHAVYLGRPGANQNCPSWLVGTTEALVVQPWAAAAQRRTVENPVAQQITATAPRIKVIATFDTNPTLIYRILASARLAPPERVAANPAKLAAAPSLPATVANRIGLGFDACAAPSARFMSAWLRHSQYRAVGIQIGGADRACDQQNLTAGWVRREAAAGWRFIPMYVGPQAALGQLTDPVRQGTAAAMDAVQQAQRFSFGPQTPIYYDMEAYGRSASGLALQFLSSWTLELHKLGYRSGVYSSSSSGVSDLAREYHLSRFMQPDVIDDALWNGAENTADSVYLREDWPGHCRLHQFSGNVLQTLGGDTMDVNQDYLDVALTAPRPHGLAGRRSG